MKVKLLKSVKYAFHPAFGPQVSFKKDQEFGTKKAALTTTGEKFTPSIAECQVLVDIGYAEITEGSEDDVPDEEEGSDELNSEKNEQPDDEEPSDDDDSEEKPLIDDLMKKLEIITDSNEKKSVIEDWATVNLGIDLDRRKSVDKMLAVVQKNL
jgi:hypothetical protein